jgi:hypothetical protein
MVMAWKPAEVHRIRGFQRKENIVLDLIVLLVVTLV